MSTLVRWVLAGIPLVVLAIAVIQEIIREVTEKTNPAPGLDSHAEPD